MRRFINELVLEEESAQRNGSGEYASHFELYQHAMKEIGADTGSSATFVQAVNEQGIRTALELSFVPTPSRTFTLTTFRFIEINKPHHVAAALALVREHIISQMFRSVLRHIGASAAQTPTFHYYLNRHIAFDEDFHAPLSLRLLNTLCAGDQEKIDESFEAATEAVEARLAFWDGVLTAINASTAQARFVKP